MGLGRKGIFLSLSAILLVGVLFVVFAPTEQRELSSDTRQYVSDTVSRISSLQTSELELWLEHVTRTTLNDLAHVSVSSPFSSAEDVQEAFVSCVLVQEQADYICQETDSQRLTPRDRLDELEAFYREELGYETASIELLTISLFPAGPRNLAVSATFHVSFVDNATRLSIDREIQVERLVSLRGFTDPLVLRFGGSPELENYPSIVFSPTTFRTSTDGAQQFLDHARQRTYVATNASFPGVPFLDRFTHNLQPQFADSIHYLYPPGYFSSSQQSHVDFQYNLETGTQQELCLIGVQDPEFGWVFVDSRFQRVYNLYDLQELNTDLAGAC